MGIGIAACGIRSLVGSTCGNFKKTHTSTFHLLGIRYAYGVGCICQVRETSSGAIISCWRANVDAESVAFSSDEHQIVLKSKYGDHEIWDIESGTKISAESHAEMLINSSSTGDRIQYCTMREHWTLTLRDTINGTNRVIYEGDHSVRSLKLSPNGCRVASLVTRTVIYVWDTYTGRLLGRSPAAALPTRGPVRLSIHVRESDDRE